MENLIKIYQKLNINMLSFIFLLAGCVATTHLPIKKISDIEATIQRAQENNASYYAPIELKLAEEKLIQAKAAINARDYETAQLIADEAILDALVAEAKSKAEKTKKLTQEMKESVDMLKKDISRKL